METLGSSAAVAPRGEDFSGNTKGAGLLRSFRLVFERVLRFAEHQQPLFHEAEIVTRNLRELLKTLAAGQAEVANEERSPGHLG